MKRAKVMVVVVCVLGLTASLFAAGPGKAKAGDGESKVILSWAEFVKITGYGQPGVVKDPNVLTIPWKDVQELLGVELKDLKGMDKTMVNLPWKDFKVLLEWSVKRTKPKEKPEIPPPADYIVTSSQYVGTLSADGAQFTRNVKLDILRKKGWKRIPILPAGVAVKEVKLPLGVYLHSTGSVYELLTEKSGSMDIVLKFSVAVRKSTGASSVSFVSTPHCSSVLDLTVAGKDVDVKVAGAQSLVTTVDDGKTRVAAAIASGVGVNITWQRALPKVKAAPTKLYAETRTLVAVAEGILICTESVDFNILHTAVKELKLTVPEGVSVLEVIGRNVHDWRVDKGQLVVLPRGEVIGPYNLRISYEMQSAGAVEIPVLRADGVEREKGFVGVIALANVEIKAGKVTGAAVIDVKRLPSSISAMTNQPILLGFRYVSDKFSIPLTVKKHGEVSVLVTIVDSAMYTIMQLSDGRRMTRAIYTVRNNRNQFLRVKMPAGADIWSASVGGKTVGPAVDDKKNVLIPLIRSAVGARELASFPVELVYVETPEKTAPASGKMHVELPKLNTPAMHVMANYYAPAEGKYGQPGGLFAAPKGGFTGTLHQVDKFTSMSADRGGKVVVRDAARRAQRMQKQFNVKMTTEAQAAGVTPIRVRLPINGKIFKLEKILALPGDNLYFDVVYSDWKASE